MKTAAVAGDGIVGQLMAFMLCHAGWHVTLYSAGKQPNCSMAAAGLLTPVTELERNDPLIFQLGVEALTTHWPAILNMFPEDIYFRQWGSVMLCHPRDKADLKKFIQVIEKKLGSSNHYQYLHQNDIQSLEPEIKNVDEGYYFSLEGQIDCQTFLKRLAKYLKKHIVWIKNRVWDIEPGKIVSSEGTKFFDCVFDCRGLGAKEVFPDLRSVRGELIWLQAPDVNIQRPIRYLHPRYSLYVVPRPDHVYLVGASEIETEDNAPISVRTTLELLTAVYSVQPKFAEAKIIKTVTQCRPTLSDNLPKIKYTDKFIAINGLYRHGFLISPTLVADVMRWLEQGIAAVHHPQLFCEFET